MAASSQLEMDPLTKLPVRPFREEASRVAAVDERRIRNLVPSWLKNVYIYIYVYIYMGIYKYVQIFMDISLYVYMHMGLHTYTHGSVYLVHRQIRVQ